MRRCILLFGRTLLKEDDGRKGYHLAIPDEEPRFGF